MEEENKLERNNVENFMSLTSLQQGMLFHYISDENSTEYHEQLCMTITGDLKVALLQKAWNLVIENNEMLRTVFRWKGIDNPVQIVIKEHQVLIKYIDFTNKLDKDNAVEDIKLKDLSSRIDITKETLRVYLIKLEDYTHKMIVSNNHILYDGWSTGIIYKELMNIYTCLYRNKEFNKINKIKFSEFIKYTKSLDKDKQRDYWVNYLENLDVKNDYFCYKGNSIFKEFSYKINEIITNKIKSFAKDNKISLAAILYSTWSVLIQKLTNSNEVLFGTTVSGRPETIKPIDNIVGLFINTIPLRVKSENQITFMNLIHKIDNTLKERKDFENTSLVDIKEYCGLKSNEDLFNSIVIIENYPLDLNLNKENVLTIKNFEIIEKTNYNMALEILTFENLELKFNFNSLAIDEDMVKRLGSYFENLLNVLLDNKNIKMLDVDLLSKEERNQILYKFNSTKSDYPRDKTIKNLFEEQVDKTPNNIAVVFEEKKLTYKELNEKANQLARVLRNKGVKSDSIVGIMVEKSIEVIIGILGILKSGGAYLPIDRMNSKERTEYILRDSDSKILLSTKSLSDNIDFNGEIIDLFEKNLFEGDLSNLQEISNFNNLAYITYNSRIMSEPKGVMCEHRNISRLVKNINYIELKKDDRILQTSPMMLDASIFEIWGALLNGIELYLVDNEIILSPNLLEKLLIKNNITILWLTSKLFNQIVEENAEIFGTLRCLLIGGEGVSPKYINLVRKKCKNIKVMNSYGPIENTTFSTNYLVDKDYIFNVPIGKPNRNTRAYIVDKNYRLVPIGFYGELCIGGDGLSRGYLNKPELTEEKFIENPFESSSKMYKTGNLARWLPDGNIELLGKIDNQINIEEKQLIITATFTAESIEKYIKWWCKQFNENVSIKFAPYNQVFQQLLDKSSLVSKNTGINIVLVHFEDWIREIRSEEEKCNILDRNFEDLIRALENQKEETSYLIGVFPISTHLGLSNKVVKHIQQLNARIKECLKDMKNFYIIDFTNLDKLYGIKEVFDAIMDKAGHLSFTDEYYAAMGTRIARKVCAIQRPSPFKVIVLDCDNTLWKGICGEEGPLGIKLEKPYREFQKLLIQKKNEGMLLVLCSKNNERDVLDVFEKNHEMLIKKEDLVAWKINWRNKVDNIKQLAKELNLGLDSFIFIDDSNLECYQVMMSCPEVLTLKLPSDYNMIPMYMKHVWALDREQVTSEDKNRTQMYKAEKQRKDFLEEKISISSFLESLQIKMSMSLLKDQDITRASQLTQRTNQFNCSTIRRTEEELRQLIKNKDQKCWEVKVKDKFGEYGLVGLIIAEKKDRNLFIDTFLLSCRALGKKIEHAMLIGLRRYCKAERLNSVLIKVLQTTKNKPFIDFIEKEKWKTTKNIDGCIQYELEIDKITESIEYVECYYDCNYDGGVIDDAYLESELEIASSSQTEYYEQIKVEKSKNDFNWNVEMVNKENLLYINHLLAIENYSGEKLLKLPIDIKTKDYVLNRQEYEAPTNEIEEKLTNIWSEILKVNKIGRNDNFFDLGGNSLNGVSLMSRIHKEFNVEIQLGELFKTPVLKKVAENIAKSESSEYSSIKQVEERVSYKVSSAQKRMYTLNQFNKDSIIYNITDVMKINGNLKKDKVEKIFGNLVKRHDSFRTYFEVENGEVVQKIQKEVEFKMEYEELDRAGEDVVKERVSNFVRPFDLSKAPLLRVKLLKVGEKKNILMIDMHHIISDGTSMRILMREFTKMYKGEDL